jgi:hypothetical protein
MRAPELVSPDGANAASGFEVFAETCGPWLDGTGVDIAGFGGRVSATGGEWDVEDVVPDVVVMSLAPRGCHRPSPRGDWVKAGEGAGGTTGAGGGTRRTFFFE